MGIFDKWKKKAADMAGEHGDKIEGGIDKAADFADEKTGGKYTDKIEGGSEKAKDLLDGLGEGSE